MVFQMAEVAVPRELFRDILRASRWKFGATVQSQPKGGRKCRFNESNITMMAFIKRGARGVRDELGRELG